MSGLVAAAAGEHTAQRLAHGRSPLPPKRPPLGLFRGPKGPKRKGVGLKPGGFSEHRKVDEVLRSQALVLGSLRGSLCPPVASASIGAGWCVMRWGQV